MKILTTKQNDLKQEFLKKYTLLEISEHEINEDKQDYLKNTKKDTNLYYELFNNFVMPIENAEIRKGNTDIIFRSFMKDSEKENSILLLFDGLENNEVYI